MAVFLSPEWVADLDAAARHLPPPPAEPDGATRTVLGIEVEPGDGYHWVFDGAGAHAALGVPADADVVLTCDRDTALALMDATINAQQALVEGRLRLRGAVERLGVMREWMPLLQDAFAAVRAHTER